MSETQQKMSKGAFEVNRTIPLLPVATGKLEATVRKIRAIEPVINAQVDRRGRLRVRYDASIIGIRDIERLLDENEIGRSSSSWCRFKSAYYRFLDGNARSNALSKGGACCNRTPTPWNGERNVDR